jgi:outer membrane protein assembly factor BamB
VSAEQSWTDANGVTWSNPIRITDNPNIDDRPSIIETPSYGPLQVFTKWILWYSDISGGPNIFYKTSADSDGASWSAAEQLTTVGANYRPATAIVRDGSSYSLWVVWGSQRPGSNGFDIYYNYFAEILPFEWDWQPTDIRLNPSGWDFSGMDQDPSIIQSSGELMDGIIWIAWCSDVAGDYDIYLTRSPDGGTTWFAPKKLGSNYGYLGDEMYPSMIQKGNQIWITFHSNMDGDDEIYLAIYDHATNTFTQGPKLTNNLVQDRHPTILKKQNGEIWIVWDRDGKIYYTFTSDQGISWKPEEGITNDPSIDQAPWISQTHDERVWVTWATNRDGNPESYAMYGEQPKYWPMFHHDLRHTGYSTSIAPDTDNRVWIKDIGSRITSSPAIIDGKVFITSENGRVYCLDESTGALIWDQSIGGGYGWSSSPAVHDNKVFVGANDGKVYCLDANSGGIIWDYQTGGNVESSPAVADGKVFIGSRDGYVYCLGETTGSFIWSYPTGEIHMSSPAVADGKVFIGSYDHNVYCLDEGTGSFIWNFTTGINIESSPAVIDNKVFIGGLDHYFYCLDEATGTLLWSYFVGDDEGIWSTPAVADGKVFFGTSVGYGNEHGVYCLDETTGSFIWKYSTENHVESSPAVADGKVYFGSRDTYVYCVDELTGALIWKYKTGNIIYSSPAIANGKVFIGSHDNKVYAFGAAKFIANFMTTEGEPHRFNVIISDGEWVQKFDNVTYIEKEVPENFTFTAMYNFGTYYNMYEFLLSLSPGESKEFEFYAINPDSAIGRVKPYLVGKEVGTIVNLTSEYFDSTLTYTVEGEPSHKCVFVDTWIQAPTDPCSGPRYVCTWAKYNGELQAISACDNTDGFDPSANGGLGKITEDLPKKISLRSAATISYGFSSVGENRTPVGVRQALYNHARIGEYKLKLLTHDGLTYDPPYFYPQWEVLSGSNHLQLYDLPEGYASLLYPILVSDTVDAIVLDVYPPKIAELRPFDFSVAAELFFGKSAYSNLTHSAEAIKVDVYTETNRDWWGYFVLPDTVTVAAARSYDGVVWHDLDELYDYTINLVDGYRIVVVRITPETEQLILKYSPVPIPVLAFYPPEVDIPLDSTKTVNLTLSRAPNGLSGYNLTASLSNSSVAEILSVNFPDWATLYDNSMLPSDSVWIKATDLNDRIKRGESNITLATLIIRGDKQGKSDILINVTKIDDDDGNPIYPITIPGQVNVVPSCGITFPGCTNPPTDPDNDGLCEDTNGNGRKDFYDVIVFFKNLEWVEKNQPIECYDFNKNGHIDFDDIVKLFEEI